MENKYPEIHYCIKHGRMVAMFKGNKFHLLDYGHDRNEVSPYASLDIMECFGPFAEVPPPPVLTEEDWEQILSMKNEVEQWLS